MYLWWKVDERWSSYHSIKFARWNAWENSWQSPRGGNCHSRAREGLFCPNVSKHNKEKVAICGVCNKYRNYQVKESLLPHRVPDRPWQVLAVDMFVLAQGKIVVLVNYYWKYFELTQFKDSTIAFVINCLKRHNVKTRNNGGSPFR